MMLIIEIGLENKDFVYGRRRGNSDKIEIDRSGCYSSGLSVCFFHIYLGRNVVLVRRLDKMDSGMDSFISLDAHALGQPDNSAQNESVITCRTDKTAKVRVEIRYVPDAVNRNACHDFHTTPVHQER